MVIFDTLRANERRSIESGGRLSVCKEAQTCACPRVGPHDTHKTPAGIDSVAPVPRQDGRLEGCWQHPVAIHLADVTRKDHIRFLTTEQSTHFAHPAIVLVFMVNETDQERA